MNQWCEKKPTKIILKFQNMINSTAIWKKQVEKAAMKKFISILFLYSANHQRYVKLMQHYILRWNFPLPKTIS